MCFTLCDVSGRQNSALRQYHVLFFGDEGEHGWVLETTSLPYAGRAAFDAHCQTMVARLPAKDRKNYAVAPNRRRAWEVAVSSAEHAWTLSREQRIDEFLPPMSSYSHSASRNLDASGRISSVVGCNSESSSRDFDVEPDGDCPSTVLSKRNGRDLGAASPERFAAFCRHHRKSLCLMHPGFTTDQIDRLLAMQWNELDSVVKLQYSG